MNDQSNMTEGAAAGSAMAGAAEPSLEDRAKALVADFEHAHKHNAPMTPSMLKELKALLPHGEPNETSSVG